jgi:acyl-CoA synthetase (NDP forming)
MSANQLTIVSPPRSAPGLADTAGGVDALAADGTVIRIRPVRPDDADDLRAPAAVVLSAGFGESGQAGSAREADLLRTARTAGMRLLGPNSVGVLNTDPAIRLRASTAAAARPGALAVASQSGAVGIGLLSAAGRGGIGTSTFVSLGNKADVSVNDLLSYWYDDPATRAVALYLDSVGNPRRFARIARAIGRRKPVLAVKSGRRRPAEHGSLADATIEALFAQSGVIRCDGVPDLLDTARLVVDRPLPSGHRVAVIGNTGGINSLCADACAAGGLEMTDLPQDARARIHAAAPGAVTLANPVDLGTAAGPDAVRAAMRAAAPHVDALAVAFGAIGGPDPARVISAIGAEADDLGVPVVVILVGIDEPPNALGDSADVHLLRKDDAGGVALDLTDGESVTDAYRRITRVTGSDHVVVEAQVPPGVELVIGIGYDHRFGPLITCGVAGPPTDLLGDRSVGLLPLTDRDAAAMWRGLRMAPLLTGYHGAPNIDTGAVEDILVRLARLAEDVPEIARLDLDPVVAQRHGIVVTDAKLLLTSPDGRSAASASEVTAS